MKNLKSHFRFNKQERSGIFFLLVIIVSLQVGYFFFHDFLDRAADNSLILNTDQQAEIDALKAAALRKDSVKMYPFNPNFITDYKGYVLGMSTDEIDRLHTFRKWNKFVNTPEEFQQVTQISDSLLDAISPHFKFPNWTRNRGSQNSEYTRTSRNPVNAGQNYRSTNEDRATDNQRPKSYDQTPIAVSDLNTATAEELQSVSGIGPKLSARIVKFRDRLGGFLVDEQLYDVYGLEPEVVEGALQRFKVLEKPSIQKININEASAEELAKLVYIRPSIAYRIVELRDRQGSILSFDELNDIEGFPSERIPRIALYLSL